MKSDPYSRYLRIAQGEDHLAKESADEFERFSKGEEKDYTGSVIILVFSAFLLLIIL